MKLKWFKYLWYTQGEYVAGIINAYNTDEANDIFIQHYSESLDGDDPDVEFEEVEFDDGLCEIYYG